MSSKRYPEEFKIEAVKQVTEKGHSVAEVEGQQPIAYMRGSNVMAQTRPTIKPNQKKAPRYADLRKSCNVLLTSGIY